MRKLIWCAALAMMASACGMYFAGQYVLRNPDSCLTRCTVAAYEATTDLNPIFRMGRACSRRMQDSMNRLMARAQRYSEPPQSCTRPVCSAPGRLPLDTNDANRFELIKVRQLSDQTGDANEIVRTENVEGSEVQPTPPAAGSPGTMPYIAEGGVIGSAEESAPPASAPSTMPRCAEDKQPAEAPSTMPYLDDEDDDVDDKALYEYWKKLFTQEEPAKDEKDLAPADAPKNDNSVTPQSEESENTPYQDSYPDPKMSSSTEPPTACPGCPSSSSPAPCVVCPYTGQSYPVDNPVPAPKEKKKRKKKKPDSTTSGQAEESSTFEVGENTNAGLGGSAISKSVAKEKGTEDVPVHTEVDTMEFRKSDAHQGEFDPMPQ